MRNLQRYILVASLWFCGGGAAIATEWKASVTQGVEYDNNTHGVENDAASEVALSTSFTAELEHSSASIEAELGYDLSYVGYRENEFSDTHSVDGAGKVSWIILPERFRWFVSDEQGYSVVNSQESDTPENRAQKRSRATGPVISVPISPVDTAEFEAEYMVSTVDADNKTESEIRTATVTWEHLLSTTKDLNVSYSRSNTEFGESSDGFESSNLSVALNTVQAAGSIDLSVGVDRLDMDSGENSTSTSYDLALTRIFSRAEVEVSAVRLLTDSVSSGGNTDTDQNYDVEEALIRTVYSFELQSSHIGPRTNVVTGVSWQLDDFQTAGTTQLSKNFDVELSHSLTSQLSLSSAYAYQWLEFDEGQKRVDIEHILSFSLDYQLRQDLEIGAGAETSIRRYGRDDSSGASSYDIRKSTLELTATYTFR